MATARAQHGVLTIEQLTAHAVSGRRRKRMLDEGVIVPLQRGVYRLATHPESFEQRCLAALLAALDAVISGPTAGRLWGFRKCFTDDVHVIARRAIDLPGVIAHRTDFLRPSDVTHVGAFRVLRPARLICDLGAFVSDADLESVIEQVLDRGLASMPLIRSVARLFSAPGRTGCRRVVRVLDSRSDWIRPADSDLELRVDRELRRQGVLMVRQYRVELDGGALVFLDLADPELKFGIEVDHVTWHGGRLDTQRDKARDRALTRIGWTVVRVTDADLRSRFDQTISELVDIAQRLGGHTAA
jgi:very-short-patch-repair endonuclease